MKESRVLKPMLLVVGIPIVLIGGGIMLAPIAFNAVINGVSLGAEASLLSETRASGAILCAIGLFVVAGAFVHRLRFTALVVSALGYLAYGFARVLSLALDGTPDPSIVWAAVAEIAFGVASLYVLLKYRASPPNRHANDAFGRRDISLTERLVPTSPKILTR